MNVEEFMIKQGWKKGEGLRAGSIKKPVLVKHRKNNKGLGYSPLATEGWWERVFDGHLKSLDAINGSNGEVTFAVDEEKRRKSTSPLYSFFRPGGMLKGTLEESAPEPTTQLTSSRKERSSKERSSKKESKVKDGKVSKKTKSKSKSESKSKSKSKSSSDSTEKKKKKDHKKKDKQPKS